MRQAKRQRLINQGVPALVVDIAERTAKRRRDGLAEITRDLRANPNLAKRHAAKMGHLDRTFAHLPRDCDQLAKQRANQLDAVEMPRRDSLGRDISKRLGNVRIA